MRSLFLLFFLALSPLLQADRFNVVTGWEPYRIGNGTRPEIKLQLQLTSPRQVRVTWRLTDLTDAAVSQGEIPLAAYPAGTTSIPVSAVLPGNGFYRFQATFYSADGKSGEVVETNLAAVPVSASTAMDCESPFGVNGHGNWKHFALLRRLGATVSRFDLPWMMVEKQSGQWNYSVIDNLVEESKKHGIQLFAILGKNPSWLKVPAGQGTDPEKFLDYVRRTVTRYKDTIFYWDLWNEPQYTWTGSKAEFGLLMERAYLLIKKIQPQSVVIFNGHPFEEELRGYTLENLKPLKGRIPFDALGMHPYSRPKSPDDIDFFFHLSRIRQWLEQAAPGRRLWVSELGWPTSNDSGGVSQRQQAAYLARSVIMSLAAGAKKYIWYQPYSGKTFDYHESQYGFLTGDLTPKPAAAVYANLASLLHPARYGEEVKMGSALRCFSFQNDRATMFFLWSVKDPVRLELPEPLAKSVRLFRADGSPLAAEGKALPIDDLPIVIVSAPNVVASVKKNLLSSRLQLRQPVIIKSFTPDRDGLRIIFQNRDVQARKVRFELSLPSGTSFSNSAYNRTVPARFDFTVPESEKEILFRVNYPALPVEEIIESVITCDNSRNRCELPLRLESAFRVGQIKIDGNLDDWKTFRPIVLNSRRNIAPADMQKEWRGSDDLSARIWIGWNERGLYFAAMVTDDLQVNRQPVNRIWAEDSVQLGICLTRGVVPDHYDLHSTEITAALTDTGVKSDVSAGGGRRGTMDCAVIRQGNLTCYEIMAPWSLLSATSLPQPGDFISVSFLFNDRDRAGRKWLELSPGIGIVKNPSLFPRFQLLNP